MWFDKVIAKIKRCSFFASKCRVDIQFCVAACHPSCTTCNVNKGGFCDGQAFCAPNTYFDAVSKTCEGKRHYFFLRMLCSFFLSSYPTFHLNLRRLLLRGNMRDPFETLAQCAQSY